MYQNLPKNDQKKVSKKRPSKKKRSLLTSLKKFVQFTFTGNQNEVQIAWGGEGVVLQKSDILCWLGSSKLDMNAITKVNF